MAETDFCWQKPNPVQKDVQFRNKWTIKGQPGKMAIKIEYVYVSAVTILYVKCSSVMTRSFSKTENWYRPLSYQNVYVQLSHQNYFA